MIQERFVDLKNIFVNLMSGDNYPHIGLNDFVSFCRDTEVLDGSMPTSTVDRMFIATKVNAPLRSDQVGGRARLTAAVIRH